MLRGIIAQAKHDFEQLHGEGSAIRDGLAVLAATLAFFAAAVAIAGMLEG